VEKGIDPEEKQLLPKIIEFIDILKKNIYLVTRP
jgi:hypothetical protein